MTIGKLSGQCDFGQKGQSYCNQRGQSCVAKRVKVAWLFHKGYDQHYVVLHDTMLPLMRTYDGKIDGLIPNRRVFFPTPDDKPHPPVWVTYHFKVLWQSCNSSRAIPYELRHNYAIENINSWTHQGFAVHDKLLALSKSMGHRQIESTLAYYSLTPAISDIMACTDNEISQQLTQDDYEKED